MIRHAVWFLLGIVSLELGAACGWGGELGATSRLTRSEHQTRPLFHALFTPLPEDQPFFQAIAEAQEKQLRTCQEPQVCQRAHFLRALAMLYKDQELAAHHFCQVVAVQPDTPLAIRSRFWLWLLDIVRSPINHADDTDVARRLVREIVERELAVGGLDTQPEPESLTVLRQEVKLRDKKVAELTRTIAELTKQLEQLKKQAALREAVEQELRQSEKRVQELTKQLEALRRIDQELKEKAPPTRPSEKMTPAPEAETNLPANGS
ncbi:MAG: hypothetical protein D6690_09005 [Nitrospirae bacterium]|nr:MAG: hypothetical protein D6690_09005 [Nitrospirota bacterium]